MVAIVTGTGLGLERSSAFVLGSNAQLGTSSLGRANEGAYVNAANGNLILTNRDEFLIGRGPDSAINRTYNSQGLLNDDNGDNWRISTHRRVYGLTGTLNTVGSTVRRTDWDGSETVYTWDVTRSAYVSKEASGAYDIITRANSTSTTPWIWTDGDSQYSELYDDANGGRITSRRDTHRDSSGNAVNVVTYGYDASGRLNKVTTADGNFTDLVWDNTAGKTNNLLMLTTSYTDTVTSTTKYLTRTRYTYDASNRLQTVTVDLTPEHASGAAGTATADGRTYTTTYSYDGTSRRIASVAQTDGSLLSFTYILVDGAYRVASFTQTVESGNRTTNFVYNTLARTTTITDHTGIVTTLTYDSANHLIRQSVAPVAGGNEQITTYAYAGNDFAARNLTLHSDGLEKAVWVKTTTTVLANDAARPAPNGAGNTAEKLTFGASGGKLVQSFSTLAHGVSYIADIWVYSATATTVQWGLLEGTNTPATYNVAANSWTRLRAEGVFTSGSTSRRLELGGGNDQVIWATQAQLRLESDPDVYVATTTAAVTSTTVFGSTDDIETIRRFDGAANESAGNWIAREDFTYDPRGNLTKRVDGAGRTVEYSYSTANQRLTETAYLTADPDGAAGAASASNPIITRYIYDDGASNGVKDDGSTYIGSDITDVSEQLLRFSISPEGRVTEYSYNADGQLIATLNYAGNIYTGTTYTERALSDWVVLSTTDKTQVQRVDYLYDFRGNVKQETRWSRTTSAGLGDAGYDWSRVDYIYDQYGLLLSKLQSGTAAGFVVPNPVAETYVYDGMGRAISFKDSGNFTTTTAYLDSHSKTQVILANGAITTSQYNKAGELVNSVQTTGTAQLNVLPASILAWTTSGDRTDDGAGPVRSRITIKNNTSYSVTSAPTNVVAGDQITWRITLRRIGTLSTTELWAWATASGYGTADLSSARVVDGPGSVAQFSPGKFTLQGLSNSEFTTIEVTRIFTQAESYTPQIYTYMGSIPSSNSQGIVVVNDMAVTKTTFSRTVNSYDNRGLLRISTDPLGVKTYYVYDRAGRRTGEIDGDGSLTEYRYDAADRVIATIRYANAVSAAGLSALDNPLSNNEVAGICPAGNTADRWSWNIYDKAGKLVQTIDAAGAIREFAYDGAGRLTGDARFATMLSAAVVNSYQTTLPTAPIAPPALDDLGDRRTFYYYDNDGQQIGMLDEDGYLTEYVYDKAGRKIESIRYAKQAGHNLAEASRPSHWRNSTFATLKSTADDNPTADIHNYWLYDGRGLLAATVDGEGNVTRYHHSAQGQVFQEIVGRKVDIAAYAATTAAQRTLGNLQGWYLGGNSEDVTDFTYDSRGQLVSRVRQLSGGTETTVWTYDSVGNRLTETTSETVSTETRAQSFRYDLKGRLIASMGGNGSAALAALGANPTQAQIDTIYATYGTRFVYDAAHRLIQKITPDGTGTTGNKTLYYYDGDGQLRYEINALGEVVETIYNKLEDRTETIVYATRISTSGLSGGLVTASLSAVIANAAQNAGHATTGGSDYDSRTQYSYTNRGELFVTYNPLYPTSPTQSNYGVLYYNRFGDVQQSLIPTDTPAYHWNNSSYAYNRRGLTAGKQWLLNGSGTGAMHNSYGHDAFGRIAVEHTNNTDWRYLSYEYDRANRLSVSYDRTAAATHFAYDARSNLISQTDRNSRTTTFAYDKFNRNVTTTTAEGVATTVKKNAYGQTIEISIPGIHFADGLARTTRYSYDKNGNLDEVWEAWGTSQQRKITDNDYDYADRLTKVTDARGVVKTYSYDAAGRVLTETRDAGSGTRSISGLPSTYANITTAYAYDAKGQQIQITSALGTAQQRVDLFLYDLKGQKTQIVVDSGGLNLRTDYAYRADGKVATMTEAVGTPSARATAYEYDSIGRLLKTRIDPTGLNLTTELVYDVNDNVVAMKNENGFITRFVYDKENRQILSVNAEGEVVETGYDAEGRAIWTRGYATRVSPNSWALEVAESTVRASLVVDTVKDIINRTVYDRDGRKVFAVDGENYVTAFIYDGANNLTKTIRFAGKTNDTALALTTNAQGSLSGFDKTNPPATAAVTSFTYDAANRLTSTTDAENYSEYYEYDAAGNRTKLTNKLGGVTDYEYDALGRLRSEKVNAPVYDQNGNLLASSFYKSFFEYDAVGNVSRQVEGQLSYLNVGAAAESSAKVTSYSYDKANRLITKILPQVQEYDAASGGDTQVTPDEHYEYDARGNLILFTDGSDAKTFYYYDAANRKTVEISATKNATTGTYVKYTYDAHGNLKSRKVFGSDVTLPTSTTSPMPGEPSGEVRETQFDYDTLNRLTYTKTPNIRTGLFNGTNYVSTGLITLESRQEYDAFGNMVKETDANGNAIFHYYDRRGLETAKVDQENYLTRWERDQEGNVVEEIRFAAKVASAPTIQLVPTGAASADNRKTTFAYDKNGRRRFEVRHEIANVATVSAANGGLTLASALSNASIEYQYNALGQVVAKIEANADRTDYLYDNQGRLTLQRDAAITDHAGVTVRRRTLMNYDAQGNLVRTTEQGVDAVDNYASGYSPATDRVTRYQYGAGGRLRTMTDATNAVTTYQYDRRGNIRRQSVATTTSDVNTAITIATINSYDIAGRQIGQYSTSTGLSDTPVQGIAYNAYGEVASKSVGGVTTEQFSYDLAGRVVKTNAGDGVWKFFVYDKNGNATLTLTARGQFSGSVAGGTDVSGFDQLTALNAITGGASSLALASFTQTALLASIATYDKRGMAIASHEPGREVAGTTQTISRSQSYNAFGETLSETDARGNTTSYSYNTMGRMIRKTAPAVKAVRENGQEVWIKPAEDYYYDIAGRMVAMRDAQDLDADSGAAFDWSYELTAQAGNNAANAAIKKDNRGYLTTRILLAGTGHAANGDDALVVKEYRPDGSDQESYYDAYRDLRISKDGLDRATLQSFDKMGRLTQITRPATSYQLSPGVTTTGSLIESYSYDGLGRRVRAWNNHYGSTDAATTDYDALGRVISTRAQGGDVTNVSYVWNGSELNAAQGAFTGWEEKTTYANTMTSVSRTDVFGREIAKRDMGGRQWRYEYDRAGRMVLGGQWTGSAVDAANRTAYAYFNSGLVQSMAGLTGTESYTYDANGNRLSELGTNASGQYKNAIASYDALNRITQWNEYSNIALLPAATTTSYDAVGNIRRTQATHYNIDGYGNAAGYAPNKDYWYSFDALNRVVTDKGQLSGTAGASGTVIVRGSGSSLEYNAAGERKQSIETTGGTAKIFNPEYEPNSGQPQWLYVPYSGDRRTDYSFDAMGRISEVRVAEVSWSNNGDGTITVNPPPAVGTLVSSLHYDLQGRTVIQRDYGGLGTANELTYERLITYNAKNQITHDTSITVRKKTSGSGNDIFRAETHNDYDGDGYVGTGAGSTYALGQVVWSATQNFKNDQDSDNPDTLTGFSYVWWDGAVQSAISYDKNFSMAPPNGDYYDDGLQWIKWQFGQTNFTSQFTVNGIGQTTGAMVADGVPKSIAYTLDANGQIIRRKEMRTSPPSGTDPNLGPNEVFYRFAGKQIGLVGNNGTGDTGYSQSIAERSARPPEITSSNAGLFRNGTNVGGGYADFAQSLDPYNSNYQGSAGGGLYAVRSGDTLQGIAAALYGDGNLWYKIAEANGLSGSAALSEGQSLLLPAGVTKSTHSASTFMPYDAAEAMGDTLPTTPKPPKKPKCGTFGQILSTLVAVAAAIYFGPVLGNLVSQGFNNVIGTQSGFSWKSLGMSVVTAGVTFGMGNAFAGVQSSFVQGALRGVTANVLTQGIGVATGLQKKFDFAGVAAAGVAGGVASWAGAKLDGRSHSWARGWENGASTKTTALIANTASAIAGAATQSAISGDSFGDTLLARLPEVIGSAAMRAVGAGNFFDDVFGGKKGGGQPAGNADASHEAGHAKPTDVVETVGTVAARAAKWVGGAVARAAEAVSDEGITAPPDRVDELVVDTGRNSFARYAGDGPSPYTILRRATDLPAPEGPMRNVGAPENAATADKYAAEWERAKRDSRYRGVAQKHVDYWRGVATALRGAQSAPIQAAPPPPAEPDRSLEEYPAGEGIVVEARIAKQSESTPNVSAPSDAERKAAFERRQIDSVVRWWGEQKHQYEVIDGHGKGSFEANIRAERAEGQKADEQIRAQAQRITYDSTVGALGIFAPIEGSVRWYNGERNWENGLKIASPLAIPITRFISPLASPLINKVAQKTGFGLGGYGATRSSETIVFKNGWRTTDGKFASSTGGAVGGNSVSASAEELAIHGNSKLSPKTAYLYELVGQDGTFLKYGISQDPATRYPAAFMKGKDIFPIASGSRADMLVLERQMVTQSPGPLNLEPWAVKARGGN